MSRLCDLVPPPQVVLQLLQASQADTTQSIGQLKVWQGCWVVVAGQPLPPWAGWVVMLLVRLTARGLASRDTLFAVSAAVPEHRYVRLLQVRGLHVPVQP